MQGRHGGAAAAQRPAAEGLRGAPEPQRSLQRPAQQVRGRTNTTDSEYLQGLTKNITFKTFSCNL